MNCNNIINFENLIPVPDGIEYSISKDQIKYSVAANTDNLEQDLQQGQYPVENITTICPNQQIKGNVNLYEIRVSGYLTYSVSVKCLVSSDNFEISTFYTDINGWVSQSGVLPIESDGENDNKLPYMVVGYSVKNPATTNINVALVDLIVDPPVEISGNKVILVKGSFEITSE